MEGRKRTVQVKFYVTEEERRLIREKMKLIPTRNMAALAVTGNNGDIGNMDRSFFGIAFLHNQPLQFHIFL